MAHARQHDARIGEYPKPFCCEIDTLQCIYTLAELCTTGVITASTNLESHHLQMGWPAESAASDSDITDTEGAHDTAGESMDVEMVQCTDTTLMISSNWEKLRFDALAQEQDRAIDRALWEVQDRHTKEFEAATSTMSHNQSVGCTIHLKHRSTSHEEDIKRTREESPEIGSARPHERGCSLHHKSKSDLRVWPNQINGVLGPEVSLHVYDAPAPEVRHWADGITSPGARCQQLPDAKIQPCILQGNTLSTSYQNWLKQRPASLQCRKLPSWSRLSRGHPPPNIIRNCCMKLLRRIQ